MRLWFFSSGFRYIFIDIDVLNDAFDGLLSVDSNRFAAEGVWGVFGANAGTISVAWIAIVNEKRVACAHTILNVSITLRQTLKSQILVYD